MAPTEDEILAALAHYRSIVLQNNNSAFVRFVRHAETAVGHPASTPESITAARQCFIYRLLYVSRPENLDPSLRIDAPTDVLTKWHALVPIFALDGSHVGADLDRRAQLRQAYKSGVELGLSQVEGAEELAFPADFETLMRQVDSLEGNGWPQYREEGQQVRFWDGLGESEDEVADRVYGPDDGLAKLAGLDDWEVTAGWQCGRGPEATCFVIYCRNEVEGKDWGWRYVAQLGQYGEEIFEDVVGMLQWYETLYAPPLDHRFDVYLPDIFEN
ncbi:hypothetical protein F4820DRAFT_27032 [Hypoxylon rubiginosum]|uniref:Uncharacterized protein n=1 Tax=Hypoxylon rubiginosum TaxID=110542 RepID=A0ACB9YSB1_9PEZI|nr:hypothetical protein F4820DRAFT_27032 [Hypoxylon rubiginosum]